MLLAIVLTLLGTLAAAATTVLDDRQQPLQIERPPQRIVSLLPSLTETVCALGQCERLVGVDRYSNWPERVQQLPRMGGVGDRVAAEGHDGTVGSERGGSSAFSTT